MSHSVGDDRSRAREFASEAHLPRDRRLLVEPWGVAVEIGMGVRHRILWSECEAVIRFPDRVELVLDPNASLLIRAADWFEGETAVELVYELAPTELRIAFAGEPELRVTPYSLTGLSRHSSVVLIVAAASLVTVATIASTIGFSSHRWQAVLIAVLLLLPIWPLADGVRARLAVPGRWRQAAAATAPRARVVLDGHLAKSSRLHLRMLIPAVAVAAVLLATFWSYEVGTLAVLPLVVGAFIVRLTRRELLRRRQR